MAPATDACQTGAPSGGDQAVHIHVVNDPSVPSIYQITPALYNAALQRHRWAKSKHRLTMGNNLEGFEDAMKTAEVLVGWKFPLDDLSNYAPQIGRAHV